jgi:S1-C subfamily serine protease
MGQAGGEATAQQSSRCQLLATSAAAVAAGVLIRRVNPTSAAAQHLRADDVLMSFDGQAIACDGTVPFR